MKTVNQSNFEKEVLQSATPVMVKFTAEWCPPCKRLHPLLEEVEKEVEGKAQVVALDIDDDPELASAYKVKSIPTMIVFKGGQITKTQVGSVGKEALVKLLDLESK